MKYNLLIFMLYCLDILAALELEHIMHKHRYTEHRRLSKIVIKKKENFMK